MGSDVLNAMKVAFSEGLRLGASLKRSRGTDLADDLVLAFPAAPVRIVFDVGANVGQTALHFAEWWPQAKIYSFEPVSKAHSSLLANVADMLNILPYHLGMSDREGVGTIYVPEETSLSSMEILDCAVARVAERINLTTVDAFRQRLELPKIDLLKIDTEGHDLLVLCGAETSLRAGVIPFVQVEAALDVGDPRFIALPHFIAYLQPLGYELFGIYDQMPHLEGGRQSLGYFNAVFVHASRLPPWN